MDYSLNHKHERETNGIGISLFTHILTKCLSK